MESLLAEPAGAELDSASCKYLSETFIGLCSQAITQAKESVKESEDIQMQDWRKVRFFPVPSADHRSICPGLDANDVLSEDENYPQGWITDEVCDVW